MAVGVANTLEFLIGRWSIERVINDYRDASTLRFSGEAEVTPTNAGARYLEQGRVSTPAHTGPARRSLLFSDGGNGTVRVDFQDGRPFLGLDLSAGRARATHPCRADTYEMTFDVLSLDELLERWRVAGPAKDYAAKTLWRRR